MGRVFFENKKFLLCTLLKVGHGFSLVLLAMHIAVEFYDCTFFTRHATLTAHRPYVCHSQMYSKRTDACQVSSNVMKVEI